MKTYKNVSKGFMLIELMVALAILGTLVTTAGPIFIRAQRKAQSVQCLSTRRQVEDSVALFYNDHPDDPVPTISQLVSGGYLNGWPRCSAGGEYVWISKDIVYPKLGCSIHYWEEIQPPEKEPPKIKKPKKKPKKKTKEKK